MLENKICMQTEMGLILHTFKSRGKNLKGGVSRCCPGILGTTTNKHFQRVCSFEV